MASDVTKNTQDIENYSKEFIELQSELKQISKSQFNGISLFTTNEAEHKEGILHRVDDGIEYDGSSYNKFSRIASTHEDGDYDSGHVSINVVNLTYMLPFIFQKWEYSEGGPDFFVPPQPNDTDGAGIGASGIFRISYNIAGEVESIQVPDPLTSGNPGTGFIAGDLLFHHRNLPHSGVTLRVTSVNGTGGITGLEHVSGDFYDSDPTLMKITNFEGLRQGFLNDMHYQNIKSLSAGTFVDVIERIADARAENGAEQNRLNMVDDLLIGKHTNLEAAHGRIMDADMALESTRFARQNVLVQSSAAMVAQANQLTSISLTLLG